MESATEEKKVESRATHMTMCKFVLLLLARSRPLVLIGEKKKKGGEKEKPRGKVQYPSFSCAAGDIASPPPSFAVRQKEEEGSFPQTHFLVSPSRRLPPASLICTREKGGSDEKGRALFFLFFFCRLMPLSRRRRTRGEGL